MPPHRSTNVAYSFATPSGLSHDRALDLWSILRAAFDKIITGETSEIPFEVLYRHAYTLVAHKYGGLVYAGTIETLEQHVAGLKRSLTLTQDPMFLAYVVEAWESYNRAVSNIRDILVYLDHSFTKTTGHAPIYEAALNAFYSGFFRDNDFGVLFRDYIVLLIQKARDSFTTVAASTAAQLSRSADTGEVVGLYNGHGAPDRRDLARRCVALFIAMAPTLEVYHAWFEEQLELATRVYYEKFRDRLFTAALMSSDSFAETFRAQNPGLTRLTTENFVGISPDELARAVAIYLRAIEPCLLADEELIGDICHRSTGPKIRAIVQDSLIVQALPYILGTRSSSAAITESGGATHVLEVPGMAADTAPCVGAFASLVRSADLATLARLYRVCCREESAPRQLCAIMELEVRAAGQSIIEAAAAQKNPAQFIEQFLRLQEHYARIITSSFKSDHNLLRRLRAGLERVLSTCKESPVYLSLYIDAIFRLVSQRASRPIPGFGPLNTSSSSLAGPGSSSSSSSSSTSQDEVTSAAGGGMPEACLPASLMRQMIFTDALPQELSPSQLEHRVCGILFVFRHLNDKDAFEDAFRKHLAGRLLTVGVNVALERAMLQRLGNESIHQFTAHFNGMLKDIQISQELTDAFEGVLTSMRNNSKAGRSTHRSGILTPALLAAAENAGSAEINATVLTSSFWPLQRLECCKLPVQAAALADAFAEHYLNKHKGRKLLWQAQLGTAIVSCTFDCGTKDLLVPSYQMAILLQYSPTATVFTYAQLLQATGMPELELRRHLLSLAHPRVGILSKSPNSTKLAASDTYTFNRAFSTPGPRFVVPVLGMGIVERIGVPTGLDEESISAGKENEADSKALAEARKYRVDAAIVRIMKRNKTMLHNDLAEHVTNVLASSFPVDTALLKARIELMLEQDYLERDPADRSRYNYVA